MAVAGMAHRGSDGRHEVDAAVFHYFLWRHPGHDSGGDPADQTKTENGDRRASPGRRGLNISGARFDGILRISAAAIISTDQKQRITLFNRSAETIFGYTADEVMGQPMDLLVPERLRELHRQHFASFAESDRENMLMSQRRPLPGRRKDGREFVMTAALSQLRIGGEKIFTVICSDITPQVKAEAALPNARDQLEVRVQQRTAELETVNLALQVERTGRMLAGEVG